VRKIAVLNQKGGVGKTTTVTNTAAALAMMGLRVVVIDLDPQAHLTIHFGIDADTDGTGAYEVLTKSASFADALIEVRENLHVLGANIDLVGAESELVSVVGRETILAEAIETVEDQFDYLLIDCPPSLGLLSLNALAAVDEVFIPIQPHFLVFIPIQPHFLALQGFGKLLQTVTLVNKRINPRLKITGILLCMFDTRVTLSAEVKADIEQFLTTARTQDVPWSDAVILPIHIRRNIKLAEAPSYGKSIFEYEPDCNGSRDYESIAKFIHTKMINSPSQAASQAQALEEPVVAKAIEAIETLAETTETEVVAEEISPDQIAKSIAEIGIVEAGQERIKITEINSNASNTEAKAKEERPLDFANLNYKPQTE
jgi:chromosome partitioning protein